MITAEELRELNYGAELRDKLAELGVGEVWRKGVKKEDAISEAIEKLAKLKELESKGVTGEDAEKAIAKDKEDAKNKFETEAQKEFKAKQDLVSEEVERLKSFDKDVLQKNLELCQVNLQASTGAKRKLLVEKIKNIREALK